MAYRTLIRRGTAVQWSTVNPILLAGEFAVETDTRKFKIGDGVTDWNTLLYATQGESGKSVEYIWDGTSLGIRQEGELEYQYVDLKGESGNAGFTTGTVQPTDGSTWFKVIG